MASTRRTLNTADHSASVDSLSVPARVRSAAALVMEKARHVTIDSKNLPSLIERLEQWRSHSWMQAAPVCFNDLAVPDRLSVALLFNAMSFCYWPAPWWDNTWYVSDVRRGSWALLAALRHAIDSGVPILRSDFLRELTEEGLAAILDGRGRLALLGRRAEILREVGTVLDGDVGGGILALIGQTDHDAPALVAAILNYFPSFMDEGTFDRSTVPFAKRAQLFAADCHRILEGKGSGGLHRFAELTACADYMLPALLAREGILVYSSDLQNLVGHQVPLPSGEEHETEIRAATIVACDLLARIWGEPPMAVNDALWLKAGEVFSVAPTHHRTWTEAY